MLIAVYGYLVKLFHHGIKKYCNLIEVFFNFLEIAAEKIEVSHKIDKCRYPVTGFCTFLMNQFK